MAKTQREKKLAALLKERFGLRSLRPGQDEVIASVLQRKDTLAVMATGAGKSLCYQIPALMMKGTTVVVSPLISLMKDQAEKLNDLEINVAELNSAQKKSDIDDDMKSLKAGTMEIVHTTPERLADPDFIKALKKNKIDFIVIDEAHCVSQWGHDFRPSYLRIKDAIKALGNPPILALTATATSEIIEDIQKQLELNKLNVIETGVMRKNLYYEVHAKMTEDEKRADLIEFVRAQKGNGIIYASTVKNVNELYEILSAELDEPVAKYHGKMAAKQRNENQDLFMSGQARILVGTNAFGMGIDKADIRFVAHYNFPASLEAYYQESGRAGRDGKKSRCALFYLKADKRTQSFFLATKYPRAHEIQKVYEFLRAGSNDSQLVPTVLLKEIEGVGKKRAQVILSALLDHGLIKRASKTTLKVLLTDAPEQKFADLEKQFLDRITSDNDRLKQMIVYAQTALCRWKAILKYFDQETKWDHCKHCDNCESPIIEKEVLSAAASTEEAKLIV